MTMNGGKFPVEDEMPERVSRAELPMEPETKPSSTGGLKALLMPGMVALGICLVVVQFWVMPQFDTITKGIQALAGSVNAATTESAAAKASVATVGTQLTTINNQLTQLNNANNAASQEITAIKSREAQFLTPEKVAALQTKVDGVATTSSNLANQITQHQATIDSLTKLIATLQSTINGTTTTTTTTGGTTTTTTGLVTPTIIGNPFTGVQYLKYDTFATNTTASQMLSFQINNGTGKTINNVQLGVLLQVYDGSGASLYTLPAGTVLSVTSGSNLLGTIWSEQSTGVSYYRGFTNGALTGILGNIGAISQSPGTQTYSVTVAIANNTGTNLPAIIMYPVVKVLSYN